MANLFDWFFRQLVTEGDMDEAFDSMEASIHRLAADNQLFGVIAGGNIAENTPTPDLTVLADGPLVAYDRQGRRIAYATPSIPVDMSLDENGAPTAVGTPGAERVLSIFVRFDRVLSDPRLDGNNVTVFFRRDEGFEIVVVQGGEYTPPALPVPPALRADHILLADVTIAKDQTAIEDADIDIARREDMFVLPGDPFSIRRGLLKDALQDTVDQFNVLANADTTVSLASAILVENFAPTENGGLTSSSNTADALVGIEGTEGKIWTGIRASGSDTGLNGTVTLYKRSTGARVPIAQLASFPGTEGEVEVLFDDELVLGNTNYFLQVSTGAGAGVFTVEWVTLIS